jgi:hypothetical protein
VGAMAIWLPPRLDVVPSRGAPGLPRLPDHLLDALVTIARADGRVHCHTLRQEVLAALLGCNLVGGCGHEVVELTPLGLRVLAGVGLERIQQQAAGRRGRVPTDPSGWVRWAG